MLLKAIFSFSDQYLAYWKPVTCLWGPTSFNPNQGCHVEFLCIVSKTLLKAGESTSMCSIYTRKEKMLLRLFLFALLNTNLFWRSLEHSIMILKYLTGFAGTRRLDIITSCPLKLFKFCNINHSYCCLQCFASKQKHFMLTVEVLKCNCRLSSWIFLIHVHLLLPP